MWGELWLKCKMQFKKNYRNKNSSTIPPNLTSSLGNSVSVERAGTTDLGTVRLVAQLSCVCKDCKGSHETCAVQFLHW